MIVRNVWKIICRTFVLQTQLLQLCITHESPVRVLNTEKMKGYSSVFIKECVQLILFLFLVWHDIWCAHSSSKGKKITLILMILSPPLCHNTASLIFVTNIVLQTQTAALKSTCTFIFPTGQILLISHDP